MSTSNCTLSWEDYGDPNNVALNEYFSKPWWLYKGLSSKSLAYITEADTNVMMKEEHEAWEQLQIQVYEGTIKTTSSDICEREKNEAEQTKEA